MYISRIKFYADTAKEEKNKFFCYSCNELEFQEFFSRMFAAGHVIRAAWFEKVEEPGKKVIVNNRFPQHQLQDFLDFYLASKSQKKKIEVSRSLVSKNAFIEAALKESAVIDEIINSVLQKKS